MRFPDCQLSDCWAKTDPLSGLPALTVRDHCLVVGAVAEVVALLIPPTCRHLPPVGTVTLTAAHDIGKITPGFLRKAPLSLFSQIPGIQECQSNHALVSQAFLASQMQDKQNRPLAWGLSAGGHHGSYPTSKVRNNLGTRECLEIGDWPNLLRQDLLKELVRIFGALPRENPEIAPSSKSRIHWLTGFVTFCDWIGSNIDWFPLYPETPLRDHFTIESARTAATAALELIGWHRRTVTSGLPFARLFSASGSTGFDPRPLQETLIALADQPGLYIVEAPMGTGKTEAALAVAYRRWTEGDERGLYFALPTQLTSNRIHNRVSEFLENVVAEESTQALVHGNAWLNEERIRSFSPAATTDQEAGAKDACRWFASSRKPLLAPFGTGTIDQALMACIAAKHSALRLFALSGKVIVIDEVHSYDSYTSALVDQLIRWLLEVGCTVIVLSATLTAERRRQMIEKAGAVEPQPVPLAYPLITKVIKETSTHHEVRDPAIIETTIHLKHAHMVDSNFIDEIASAAESGACVLVIRNTVALAQQTYRAIKSAMCDGSVPVGLLHSRFPHFQRNESEKTWMEHLGKDSSKRPKGCVLIATQVVEQSVDIDADLLVTDLAPTDLLLQRLGRLHRHVRPRPIGFEKAICWILQPTVNWSSDPKTIRQGIGPSAYIYPPIALYLAQETWRPLQTVILPTEIRELLESSQLSLKSLPSGSAALSEELAQKTKNMIQKALRQGPFDSSTLQDTEGAQTRYNIQPSALLILLKEKPRTQGRETLVTPLQGSPQTVTAGRFNYDLAKLLHENAVRIPAYLVRPAMSGQPNWLGEHISDAVIAVCSSNSTSLEILEGENLLFQLSYHPDQGVQYEKARTQPTFGNDLEELDSWY